MGQWSGFPWLEAWGFESAENRDTLSLSYMANQSSFIQLIKIYNHLPKDIKDLSNNMNKFKLALKRYLSDNSFYSLKDYFDT
jgi:hypothetical protein